MIAGRDLSGRNEGMGESGQKRCEECPYRTLYNSEEVEGYKNICDGLLEYGDCRLVRHELEERRCNN